MFALRASCSSIFTATRRCPSLVARLSREARLAGTTEQLPQPDNVAGFLEDNTHDTKEPAGPTPFDDPDPPIANANGYPPASAPRFSTDSMIRSKLPEYRLHCHSSRNNTIVSFTKPNGSTIAWLSGGSTPNKFRKANRATYEAGYQCAVGIFQKIKEWNKKVEPIKLELFFKGFGEGREAMKTAMLAVEGEEIRKLVCSITDRTPIKIGGTRSKKQRRG